ncbi:MAG TPA: DedA family protein [Gaiellaceae bacterium]
MTHFVEHYGLWVVFGVVFLEVVGLPFVPGETALIAASALASQGHGSIRWIIALAIAAAVLGAGVAYAIGYHYGRALLRLWPRYEHLTRRGIERSDEFFDRYGSKAVFLGRFVPVLRATLGWMAGVGRMRAVPFMLWNVAGAVAWGFGIGLAAYYVGSAVVNTVEKDAGIGAAVIVVIVLAVGAFHLVRRRAER